MVDTQAAMEPNAVETDDAPAGEAAIPVDGRTARALRTHDAIVDACIDLVCEDELRPTAQSIATRAGVSVRSVFQHFDDLESLYAAVAERSASRVERLVFPIDADLPADERIQALVSQRVALFEALSPIRRAADVHAPFSAVIRRQLRDGNDLLRRQASKVLGPELAHLPERERCQVQDAIDVCLSWPAWTVARTTHGRSVAWAEEVLVRQVRTLVESVGRHG